MKDGVQRGVDAGAGAQPRLGAGRLAQGDPVIADDVRVLISVLVILNQNIFYLKIIVPVVLILMKIV